MDGDVDGLISLEDDSSVLEGREAHLTPSIVAEAVLLYGDTILARIEPIIAIGIMEERDDVPPFWQRDLCVLD